MEVTKDKIEKLIASGIQYLVPLFQRPYSWSDKEWKILWEDLWELHNDNNSKEHFFGSIVLIKLDPDLTEEPQDITQYQLIDGQQRLTTIFIILILLKDLLKPDSKLFATLQKLLVNSSLEDNDESFKANNHHLKLSPRVLCIGSQYLAYIAFCSDSGICIKI